MEARGIICFGVMLLLAMEVSGQFSGHVIDRHNFGFMLHKKGEVQVSTATAKVVFYYELRSKIGQNTDQTNCSILDTRLKFNCNAIKPLLTAFNALRAKGTEYLRRELDYIYDIFYEFDSQ